MVLPAIIGSGLKLFQSSRSKASSGSDMASNIVQGKGSAGGSTYRVTQGALEDARRGDGFKVTGGGGRPKISGAKFLQSTTDPSKDKIKTKEGILQGFVSIINIINKFLSSILTTLIADNKLTQKQSENERISGELALKRQRESSLEDDQDTEGVPSSKSKSKRSSFFDRIINFISSIIIGSLVLAVYRRFTDVIQFFKDTYEVIKGFFERLGDYVSPLWNIFKWITSSFSSIFKDVKPNDDEEYSKKIPKELDRIDKEGDIVEKESEELGVKDNTQDSVDPELEKSRKESDDDKDAVDKFKNFVSFMGNMDLPDSDTESSDTESTVSDTVSDTVSSDTEIADTKKGEVLGVEPPKPERLRDEVGSGEEKKVVKTRRPGTKEEQIAFFEKLLKRSESSLERTKNAKKINFANRNIDLAKTQLRLLGVEEYADYAGKEETVSPEDREAAANAMIKSGAIVPGKSSRSFTIEETKVLKLNDKKLDSIENVLGEQASANKKLADSIALLAQGEEEDDSPIIIPIPKQKTKIVGGSGGNELIVVGGDNVNSTMDKIYLAKQARVG